MQIKIYCVTCGHKKLGIIEAEVGDLLAAKNFHILKDHKDHEIIQHYL